jgi:pimeloyl-ACP methyl ester carboxylesterase
VSHANATTTAPIYEERGSGPALVFCHGTLMDRSMFRPQLEALSDEYRVVAYDHRARTHRWNDAPYDLGDLAADCNALLDELGIEKCVLGGMSMGGFVAIEFALAYQDRLDGLILLNTSARGYTEAEQAMFNEKFSANEREGKVAEDFADWCVPICFGETTINRNPDLVAHWREQWCGYEARAVFYETCWPSKEDRLERMGEITVPTLIVHGDEDTILPLESHSLPILERLPDGHLAVAPEAGHTANLEQPEVVNAAIRAFMSGIYPSWTDAASSEGP